MTTPTLPKPSSAPELGAAINSCRAALFAVAMVSGLVNLLMLTGPLFMLQVYDRVLPSRNLPTLVGLAVLALVMFAFYGILEAMRSRVLLRIGEVLNECLARRIFDSVMRVQLQGCPPADGLRDLDTVRSFLSGMGLVSLFDLPWMPIYVVVCFLFHPLLGCAVLVGAIGLCSLALLTEIATRTASDEAVRLSAARRLFMEAARRNAALLHALGLRSRMTDRWVAGNTAYLRKQRCIYDTANGLGSLSRTLRLALQSTVLGLGAYLVINQEATAGIILAATVLSARALAPVELAVAHWNGFVNARQSWQRLSDLLTAIPAEETRVALPLPSRGLRLTAVSVTALGDGPLVLHDVSFTIAAGSALGVIGPTGSGKSTLARAIVGIMKPVRGVIRLDGATLDQWSTDEFGKFIGYLPQNVELFIGTVAENVSRFETEPDPARLIGAARAAGVHDMILRLPNGYETEVGEGGERLSGGQRQRIALARALYGDPFLVVLDEPNSSLDASGEQALANAILGIRARGGIAIVVAHRPSVISAVDHLLILNEGRVQAFGPKEKIIPQPVRTPPPAAGPTPAGKNGRIADRFETRRPPHVRASQ